MDEKELEKELISTKDDPAVIQTTEPTWTLEICRKLVDLEETFANTRY